MNIIRGNKQIANVFIGDKIMTSPVHNKDMICFYESLNKDNSCFRSRNIWSDISGNNNNLTMNNMLFEDVNGWMYNSILFNNESFANGSINTLPTEFSYQFAICINSNESMTMSLPCIDYIKSIDNDLYIKFSNNNEIICNNIITYNEMIQITILYKNKMLAIYKNKDIVFQAEIESLSSNSLILLGKDINNIYSNYKCYYLLMYNKLLPLNVINSNINNLYYRYLNYYTDGLVLDLRGKDLLLDYKPNRYMKDNSIYGNHFLTDFFFNSVNSHSRRNTYNFNGYNKITCVGRKLIHEEFTIETTVQGNQEILPGKTYLCGNYSKNNYGFKIGLNSLGFIVEFTNSKETKFITYGMDYIRKMVHLAITYKDGLITMYVNGFMVRKEEFDFKNFYNNLNFYIAKQDLDEWDGYMGLMNSLRIYDKVIDIEILKSNFFIDRQFYTI